MKNNNQKGQVALIIIIIVVILIALWYFLFYTKSISPTSTQGPVIYPTATVSPSPQGYQTRTDLDTASSQLDGTNINQMDAGIIQVTADSSSF